MRRVQQFPLQFRRKPPVPGRRRIGRGRLIGTISRAGVRGRPGSGAPVRRTYLDPVQFSWRFRSLSDGATSAIVVSPTARKSAHRNILHTEQKVLMTYLPHTASNVLPWKRSKLDSAPKSLRALIPAGSGRHFRHLGKGPFGGYVQAETADRGTLTLADGPGSAHRSGGGQGTIRGVAGGG